MVPWGVHAFPGAKPALKMHLAKLRFPPVVPVVRAFVSALVVIAMVTSHASAETINVPADQPTIQAGIEAASDGDTVLAAPGTYNEQIDFLGKAIVVAGAVGSTVTTIDASGPSEWANWPYHPVVRFVNGEGTDSVLQGFTITGMESGEMGLGASAVFCVGLSPTIIDCAVVGNVVGGAAIYGDAVIRGCVVSGTSSAQGVGGVAIRTGGATIENCLVTDNYSREEQGAGVFAYGPTTITNTVFSYNHPDYGRTVVDGPVALIGCAFIGHQFHGGMFANTAAVVRGATLVDRCTFWGNSLFGSNAFVIFESDAVVNSVFWGNAMDAIDLTSVGAVTYCNVTGGYPGNGNIDQDPLFVDPAGEDYSLLPASPCIDAGDPDSPLDPDGTRGDMGAYYFPQSPASSTVRNGSGANALLLSSATDPVLGTDWIADVDCSGHNPAFAALELYEQPFSGYLLPGGELLVDVTSPSVSRLLQVHFGGVVRFDLPVPDDLALSGFEASAQAVVLGAPGYELSNALDLVAGYYGPSD